MIDINNTLDTVKLKFYNEYLYTNHIYDEGESGYHKELTKQVTSTYFDNLNLPKDSHILDVGCGPGYFLDELKSRGYTNYTGITLSPGDIELCVSKGHNIKALDISFLPQTEGYYDESVDYIFCRHALEHSPYPIFTLMEYNRVLKQGCKLYIEMPAISCDRKHEFNLNHYSVLHSDMIQALLHRTGFNINTFHNIQFTLELPNSEGKLVSVKEHFYVFEATKIRPLDIK